MAQKHTPEGERFTRLILDSFRFRGALERHGSKIAARFGQTPARWQVLGAVLEEPRTVPQIGRRMGLSRQAVQRVVNLLAEEGLIGLADNPDHLRSPLVRLTQRGQSLIGQINAAQVEWANALAEGLAVADLEAAGRTLNDLIRRLEGSEPPE